MKTYWQSVDIDGTVKTWLEASPTLHIEKYYDSCGDFIEEGLFPITLKPLQIAEITVCENGTWSYEIEREEGWYMCFDTDKISPIVLQWTGGIFKAANGASFTEDWFKCNGWICEDKIESQLLNEIRK